MSVTYAKAMIWERFRQAVDDVHLCIYLLDFKFFVGDELLDAMIPYLNMFRLCVIDRIPYAVDCAM